MSGPIDLNSLLPVPEAAKLLHIAESTLRGHLSAKRIARYHVGRRVLVSREELARFISVSGGGTPVDSESGAA